MAKPPVYIPQGVFEITIQNKVQWATVIVLMCSLLQLMRALPLSAMHPAVLTRSLVAVTVWHISIAQLILVSFDISLISGYLFLPRNHLSLFPSH